MKVTRKRVLPLLRRGPRPWPAGRGRIALTVAALLAAEAALMSMVSGAAFAAGQAGDGQMTTASDATEQTATTAGSVAAALLMARVQDRKIEATSERTETSTTYALPSGELQTAMYAGPIRKKVDGAWRDIDTSLSDTGSTLEPDVAAADIKVSDGGDTELASVSKGRKPSVWAGRPHSPHRR